MDPLFVPTLFRGGLAADDRGHLSFSHAGALPLVVKRFYTVRNHRRGFLRAWHAHQHEAKFVFPLAGTILVAAVKLEHFDGPDKHAAVGPMHRHSLSAAVPSGLYIPPGYANGWQSITDDAVVLFLSSATAEESASDDYRYPASTFRDPVDPFYIAER